MRIVATKYNHKSPSGIDGNLDKNLNAKVTAQYISDLVLEMRNLASAVELKTLQDLLELCFYQAFSDANKIEVAESELEHLRELSKASKVG
jgi:hypothetical protein